MRPDEALAAWNLDLPLRTADDGLINRTWIAGTPPSHVLQWVNPIFDPRVQLDLEAVTERLASRGLPTTRLVRTASGEPHLPDDEPASEGGRAGVWRLLTYVPGTTVHRVESTARAEAAGRLVGRFHAALAGWDHAFMAPPRRIHETPARMDELRAALEGCDGHPLEGPARELGRTILRDWARFDGALDLPERNCHGDLKVSNLRFDGAGTEGVCLVDLDTVGLMPLACEMGDAWRSWCNPAGESEPEACRFDVELFAASARGWLGALTSAGVELEAVERESLVPGIERICLELAARFCADVVRNSYFREDRERFPEPGGHNLLRARCQYRLGVSAREQRSACEDRLVSAR